MIRCFILFAYLEGALGYNTASQRVPSVTVGRRSFVSILTTAGMASASPSVALADDEATAAAIDPTPATETAVRATTISYEDFLDALFRGKAEKVQFYGSEGEEAVLTTKSGDRLKVLGGTIYGRPHPPILFATFRNNIVCKQYGPAK